MIQALTAIERVRSKGMSDSIKKGDKVKTIYGNVETVVKADEVKVITQESQRENNWYHPSNVWVQK